MGKQGGILPRYAVVLEALATAPGGLSLTEMVGATGLPKGTVHRLIAALDEVGFIAPRDGRKVYALGPRLLRLLQMGVAQATIADLVRPTLEELAAHFKETAFVARLAGVEVRSVAMVVPDSEVQSYVQPGRVMPLHAAASAKAIIAFQADDVIDEALGHARTAFTDHTHVDEAAVRADFATARRQGFAVCDEELDPGVLSYACPIRLDGAGVLYSVGIVGLSQRLGRYPQDEVIAALRDGAERIVTHLPGRAGR
jgi:DNA-binding IclR family transcriptional regulator